MQQELERVANEIDGLLRRIPSEEEELLRAIGGIKGEFRLRELRWRLFERGPAVDDEPFVCHPIKIELAGTYERLTDALLNLAAFNYLVIVDGLQVKRAARQAPLVSIEAGFTVLLYTISNEKRSQLESVPAGTAKLEAARRSLAVLESRFEERVGGWSVLRSLGRIFPRSLETVLAELSFYNGQLKFSGISRRSAVPDQISSSLAETGIFSDISKEQNGPLFSLSANLISKKAYQMWLDGTDENDNIARDPFTTTYSLQQLTQGSGASAAYPPLDKRLGDYLDRINAGGEDRPSRIAPYLVAELSPAGVFLTPAMQGAIFKTPDQKEIYVNAGSRCYNGRFTAVQQGRTLFEETLTGADGNIQTTQVVKPIESNCLVVTMPPAAYTEASFAAFEEAARAKLPSASVTMNAANVELHLLLRLFHELGDGRFNFVIDQYVPRLCVTVNRERAPFGNLLVSILRSVNLTLLEENGVFRIAAQNRAELKPPSIAASLSAPPAAGKFGDKNFSGEPVSLSITDVELGDILKFFSGKYGVRFALSEEAKRAKITADIAGLGWPQALAAALRAAQLGVLVEDNRALVVTRADLIQAELQGKAQIIY